MRREELADLIRPHLEAEGFELVECSVSRTARSQTFRIAIDREPAVSIEACERASRMISGLLDANPLLQGGYQLEVSSPGMHRPIWTPAHFRRFREEKVKIELADPDARPRVLHGIIDSVADEGDSAAVCLRLGHGEIRTVRLSEVARANLELDPWKPRARPAGAGPPMDRNRPRRPDADASGDDPRS